MYRDWEPRAALAVSPCPGLFSFAPLGRKDVAAAAAFPPSSNFFIYHFAFCILHFPPNGFLTGILTGPTSKKPLFYKGPNGLTGPDPQRGLSATRAAASPPSPITPSIQPQRSATGPSRIAPPCAPSTASRNHSPFPIRHDSLALMADDYRPDPDALLAAIQKTEAATKRGKFKVFLGMAAGVGKTYAMLRAAQRAQREGRDVVIGYVETHGRKETDALVAGLPVIPRRKAEYRGVMLEEMDLDALLARRPQLALVDELAHTNIPGSRHAKRYQDVIELLDAGIDVFTSMNVQHAESRVDTVRQITGSTVQETVPDSVLDGADIELIDLPPVELLRRLHEAKVYPPEPAELAMMNFFREGNLNALREMALRLAAEHVGQEVHDYLQAMENPGPWKAGHRLLVAVSASPHSAHMIRWTRRLAESYDCPWLAVYVEQPQPLGAEDQARLTKHLALAKELGAEVVTTSDVGVIRGLLRVATQQNATQIIVGKPGGGNLLDRLRGASSLF